MLAGAKSVSSGELTGFFLLLQEFQDIFGRIKMHSEILLREFGDIDRFLRELVERCTAGGSLLDAVAHARAKCRLPHLTGLAAVCWGVPVDMLPRDDPQ